MRILAILLLIGGLARAQVDAGARQAEAERLVLTGDFAGALVLLEPLAAEATDPAARARAEVLLRLCQAWLAGGYALERADGPTSPRAGRVRTTGEIAGLYIDGFFYGVGTGGWLALLGEAKSPTTVVLPMLLLTGVTEGAIAWADHADAFAYGRPRTISAGLRIGLMEGLAWMAWYQAQARADDELSARQASTLVWAGATTGALLGGLAGARLRTTPGRAAFTEAAALWSGAVAGLTTAALAGDDEDADDAFLLATAVGLNVGAATAAWLAGWFNPSADRALFLNLGGLGGGLLVGGLYLVFADEDAERAPGLGLTAAGVAGGLATAWLLTRDLPPDAPRAAGPGFGVGLAPLPEGGAIGMLGGRFE